MFKKWNQSTRLKFYTVTVIFMLLLTTVATIVSIKASRRADQDAEKRFALVTAAKQFSTASVDLTRHARSYASTLNTAFLDKYNNEINTYKNREKARETMDRYGINETENNAMKMMEKSSAHLADLETEAFSYAAQGDAKRATETMYSEDYMKGEAEVQKQYKIFYDSIVSRQRYGESNPYVCPGANRQYLPPNPVHSPDSPDAFLCKKRTDATDDGNQGDHDETFLRTAHRNPSLSSGK